MSHKSEIIIGRKHYFIILSGPKAIKCRGLTELTSSGYRNNLDNAWPKDRAFKLIEKKSSDENKKLNNSSYIDCLVITYRKYNVINIKI